MIIYKILIDLFILQGDTVITDLTVLILPKLYIDIFISIDVADGF